MALVGIEDIDEGRINLEKVHCLDPPRIGDFFASLYDWVCWGDGKLYAQVDAGSYVQYATMRRLELGEISCHGPRLGQELREDCAAFESKVRGFKEARNAVRQKGKSIEGITPLKDLKRKRKRKVWGSE